MCCSVGLCQMDNLTEVRSAHHADGAVPEMEYFTGCFHKSRTNIDGPHRALADRKIQPA
jgi:hypothetical protein